MSGVPELGFSWESWRNVQLDNIGPRSVRRFPGRESKQHRGESGLALPRAHSRAEAQAKQKQQGRHGQWCTKDVAEGSGSQPPTAPRKCCAQDGLYGPALKVHEQDAGACKTAVHHDATITQQSAHSLWRQCAYKNESKVDKSLGP